MPLFPSVPFPCLFIFAIVLATSSSKSFAAKPAPLPPVRYQIQYWDAPNPGTNTIAMSMNDFGQVVGWYSDVNGQPRAYLYDPAVHPNVAVDLGVLIFDAGVPVGWKITSANAINRHGVLVGSLSLIADASVRQPFVIDLNAASPTVVTLPNWGDWDYFAANQINDSGDIVGTYQNTDGSYGKFFYNPNVAGSPFFLPGAGATSIGGRGFLNNQGQVGGNLNDAGFTPYRWDPLFGSIQTFSGLTNATIFGINNSGTMCGQVNVTSGSGRNQTTKTLPMRLTTFSPNVLSSAASGTNAHAINAAGDVLISNGVIYRDDWTAFGNYVDSNKLVIGTFADITAWNTASTKVWSYMNDRGSTSNAGQIMGSISISGVLRQFLLNPVAAP